MNQILCRSIFNVLRSSKEITKIQSCSPWSFPNKVQTHEVFANYTIRSNFCSDIKVEDKKNVTHSKDRRIPVDLELSIKYLKSNEFKETYKDYKIWQLFRRNFKGQFSPSKPRIRCIEDGIVKTSNPCVICRDRYLVINYKNIELLKHFISPHTGHVYPNTLLCLCSEEYEKLCVAVTLGKNYGLLDFDVPLREFDYSKYYKILPQNFIE